MHFDQNRLSIWSDWSIEGQPLRLVAARIAESADSGSGDSMSALLLTAAVTALFSVATSLAIARLSFRFVRRGELSAELDNKREELKAALDYELQGELFRRDLDRKDRIGRQIVAWADPILVASEDLGARLGNVLDAVGYQALRSDWDSRHDPSWSNTHDYFMSSTLYVFGRYFAHEYTLREDLGADAFEAQQDKDALFAPLRKVTSALSTYPASYSRACAGQDAQVMSWQQRAMGEVLLLHDSHPPRVATYAEFLNFGAERMRHFEPLRALLIDASPNPVGNCRWLRLESSRLAVQEVRGVCRSLLGSDHKPSPDPVD